MLHVNFYLREPKAPKETPIIMRLFYDGRTIKFPTTEKIDPLFWDTDKQRAKPSKKLAHHLELNVYLENLKNVALSLFKEYQNAHGSQTPAVHVFKDALDKKLGKVEEQRVDLFGFFEQMIEQSLSGSRLNPQTGKPISANTIRTYVTTLRHLKDFRKIKKRTLDFPDIDLRFYNDYTQYLIKDLKLSTNTVGKHIQILKLVMNEALEIGYNTNLAYKSKRFITVKEKVDSIYLSTDELREIETMDLSSRPRLERVRDLFLVGCYTGLRYSDYSVLKPGNIQDDLIEITQVKTDAPVVIPVHDTVKRIIQMYNGALPASISNQKTNDYLKEMGKLVPCLQKEIVKSFTKEGKRTQTTHQKWELLTTHTARRSFATNEYLAGTPTLTIMAITGHKTEKAFLRYIKLAPADHARLLKAHWEKRKSQNLTEPS